ncbi:Protein TRANSPARENT TESTA 12 [Acorus gramineus]|uniref:Protein TRANSPARENT TESTA 12 n=1 Tax=Acorus gramineus TaxID=55184 RepID=A0AAV9A351_ACOGR|nr:Protein TRANSPARENT TESTA 12 [Acorus gramineus]
MEHERGPLLEHHSATTALFKAEDDDIEPIRGVGDFWREFKVESKKLWYLAGPAIFTSICQYSLGAVTQTFAGHVGDLELAAVSIENSVIAGFSFGVMLGMGSALETLCGQAYGAGQLDMLGIYIQRSWVILNSTALILSFLYIFAAPILCIIGQDHDIAAAAGKLSLWMIPQLFAYAMNFPIAKFLQAQSKMMVMAGISAVALVLHSFFSWLFMLKLRWGLAGAAVALNASWWVIVVAQLVYIFGGSCGRAWSGFSFEAFRNLWGFIKLSIASAVMLSVRVSNELGAAHPRTAKFSVVVVVISSFALGVFISVILLIFRRQYPSAFTSSTDVKKLVYELTPLLATSIIINNVQPVLSGVAIGAGWQAIVAYVNIACYYIFGVPLGLILGYRLDFGVKGIWYGMLSGTVLQTLILYWMIHRTNWNKEVSLFWGSYS